MGTKLLYEYEDAVRASVAQMYGRVAVGNVSNPLLALTPKELNRHVCELRGKLLERLGEAR